MTVAHEIGRELAHVFARAFIAAFRQSMNRKAAKRKRQARARTGRRR